MDRKKEIYKVLFGRIHKARAIRRAAIGLALISVFLYIVVATKASPTDGRTFLGVVCAEVGAGFLLSLIGVLMSRKKANGCINRLGVDLAEQALEQLTSDQVSEMKPLNLYFSKNYVYCPKKSFLYRYEDVVQIYIHIQQVYGTEQNRGLVLLAKNGDRNMIPVKRKQMDLVKSIAEILGTRNPDLKIGYR